MTSLQGREPAFHQPAEWEAHEAVWLAWPSHADLWGEDALMDAQAEFTALCEAIADPDSDGLPRGERLEILCRTEADLRLATWKLKSLGARFHRALYGDIWCRDSLPIFLQGAAGTRAAATFLFNGWGNKYDLPGDRELSGVVAGLSGLPRIPHGFVLEGGAVEPDGEGTILTTKQCLLHTNRNPSMSAAEIERAVAGALVGDALGASKVLWVEEGLLNDHTDGHIDTIARFVAPGRVVCMAPSGDDDPNRDVLEAIAAQLAAMTDARGRKLEVVRIPSPGRVLDEDGEVMPASYVNFYIANTAVVVPTYGTAFDEAAVEALIPLFPGRRVVGRSARTVLEGGGAFHCITQQLPRVTRTSTGDSERPRRDPITG
jgi:agmatine deiminase